MSQASTRCIGMDVHTDTIAVAYVAQEHGSEVTSLGTRGTRQCDIDHLVRKMPSPATHLIGSDAAGPGGYRLYRSLTTQDDDCWGVAPSLGKTQPSAPAAAPVPRPSVLSQTPSGASQRSCSATLSATRAGRPGARPLSGGARPWSARHRRNTSACQPLSAPSPHPPHASRVWHQHATSTSKRGACSRWWRPSRRCGEGSARWP